MRGLLCFPSALRPAFPAWMCGRGHEQWEETALSENTKMSLLIVVVHLHRKSVFAVFELRWVNMMPIWQGQILRPSLLQGRNLRHSLEATYGSASYTVRLYVWWCLSSRHLTSFQCYYMYYIVLSVRFLCSLLCRYLAQVSVTKGSRPLWDLPG